MYWIIYFKSIFENESIYYKIILILSDENDISTEQVIDWLTFNEYDFVRLNRTDELVFNKLYINELGEYDFEIHTKTYGIIKYSQIKSFWYRRGYLYFLQIICCHKVVLKNIITL